MKLLDHSLLMHPKNSGQIALRYTGYEVVCLQACVARKSTSRRERARLSSNGYVADRGYLYT